MIPFSQASLVFGLPGCSVCPYEYDRQDNYCQKCNRSQSHSLWQRKKWCYYTGLDWMIKSMLNKSLSSLRQPTEQSTLKWVKKNLSPCQTQQKKKKKPEGSEGGAGVAVWPLAVSTSIVDTHDLEGLQSLQVEHLLVHCTRMRASYVSPLIRLLRSEGWLMLILQLSDLDPNLHSLERRLSWKLDQEIKSYFILFGVL